MSSLIPERPIVVSPSLATTIGLEEAVLLQMLNDAASFAPGRNQDNYLWHQISRDDLQKRLAFWDLQTIQRIATSLKDKGIILINSAPLNQCDELSFAMNEQQTAKDQSQSVKPVTMPQHRPAKSAVLLANNWQPDEDLLQLLSMNHGIPRDFALQQLEDFLLYWRDRQQVSHSWSNKFRQHVLKEWRFQQSRQASAAQEAQVSQDINQAWSPSPDALEILQRSGVSTDFIEDAIAEFVLYWRERGQAHSTWNSKFIAHIRRQWAKFTQAMELDYEPRQIAANWQPSEDVYDILRLANIDLDFARQLVPEFVLFWRDTKEIQRSWNTKFLQHAKYQWATRHHMPTYSGQQHAGQRIANQPASTTNDIKQSPFRQLTDRSWAQGIVEDL